MVPLSAQLNNSGDAGTDRLDVDLTAQVTSRGAFGGLL